LQTELALAEWQDSRDNKPKCTEEGRRILHLDATNCAPGTKGKERYRRFLAVFHIWDRLESESGD
jgi:hypothetical protein